MLESLRTFFTEKMAVGEAGQKPSHEQSGKPPHKPSGEKAIQIATCAVLLEAATADDDLSKEELGHIHAALGQLYSIDASDVKHLMEITRREREEAIDLWQFTNLINQNYDTEEKMLLMEHIWRVILSDGTLDKFEDYIARKLKPLLRLSHKQWIEAKLRARDFHKNRV